MKRSRFPKEVMQFLDAHGVKAKDALCIALRDPEHFRRVREATTATTSPGLIVLWMRKERPLPDAVRMRKHLKEAGVDPEHEKAIMRRWFD